MNDRYLRKKKVRVVCTTKFPWEQKGHTVVLSRNSYIEEISQGSQLPGIVLM